MSSLQLRPATDRDCAFVASVWRAVAPLYEPLLPGAFEHEAQVVERFGLSTRYHTLLVEADGAALGFAGLTRLRPETAYLAQFYLLPAHQRRGHGGRALPLLERFWPDVEELVLHVHRRAPWAQSFYSACGYAVWADDEPSCRAWGGGVLAGWTPAGTQLWGKRL